MAFSFDDLKNEWDEDDGRWVLSDTVYIEQDAVYGYFALYHNGDFVEQHLDLAPLKRMGEQLVFDDGSRAF